MSIPPSCDTGARSELPLPALLLAFIAGGIWGAAAMALPPSVFAALTIVLGACGAVVIALGRLNDRTDQRILSGDLSYRAFFEHAIEGIFRTTPDGHYLDANPALAHIYGYPSAEALMSELTDIAGQLYVDPHRREQFQTEMQRHDKVTGFVSQIRLKDGATIWISENARVVRDWSGRIICYEGTVENVTARFEAERAIREGLRQAEEANRSKSAFLAAMSHELKTPLNAILGFSEIVKNEVFGPVGNLTYREYASDIHSSGIKLLSIINDVLDVSRIEGGAVTINVADCEPADIARGAIAVALTTRPGERDIALDLAEGLPLVCVDRLRLSQALANIIANAIKFTKPEGKIGVRAWRAGDSIQFAVSDEGIGMAPEKVAAALEPFRQLDGSLARRFEGAGLGLSIAKGLIELHGGKLAIASSVGRGTTVTVTLPPARTRHTADRAVA